MAHDVFISHSSVDKAVADAACEAMEKAGAKCWIAPRDILPGAEYAEGIIEAIESSKLFLLIISKDSNASPQVLREVERAVSKRVSILPMRIDDSPLSKSIEYFVSSHHWLDASTPPIEKHLSTLTETVTKFLAAKSGQKEKVSKVVTPDSEAAAKARANLEGASAPVTAKGQSPMRMVTIAAVVLVALLIVGAIYLVNNNKPKPGPQPAMSTPTAQPTRAAEADDTWKALWSELESLADSAQAKVDVRMDKSSYKIGDVMRFICTVEKDGYLNILTIAPGDDKVTVLFPNQFHPNNWVTAGQEISIPAREDTFKLRAKAPAGENLVVVLLTEQEINAYRGDDYRTAGTVFNALPEASTRAIAVEAAKGSGEFSAGQTLVNVTE